MEKTLIVADPSRTVRTLVRLGLQQTEYHIVEVGDAPSLARSLSEHRGAIVVVATELATTPDVQTGLRSSKVVLMAPVGVGVDVLAGVDGVVTIHKPVSRAAVRDALAKVEAVGAGDVDPSGEAIYPKDLHQIIAKEVEKTMAAQLHEAVAAQIGETVETQVHDVVWRLVPELAERLIKEELDRLLSDEEEAK